MNDATLPPAAAGADRLGLRMMPLDRIAPTSRFQPRRAAASAEDDEGLRQSIARIGLLDPILLWRVPETEAETWEIVAGNRRRAAFAAAGRDAIPYEVFAGAEAEAHAAAIASNTQRIPLAPVDTWRAIRAQQEMGWSLDDAARALGIPLRTARRLDKLGQLHPAILAAIETGGMPSTNWQEDAMHLVASAPMEAQARAVKDKHAFMGRRAGEHAEPNWHRLGELCRIARIPRTLALFDVEASGVVFEEDLFAEPGDTDAIATTDVAGFLAAQRQALQDRVAKSKAKTPRRAVAWNAKAGTPTIPAGWMLTWDAKAPGVELFLAVTESGNNIGKIAEVHAVPPAKELARRQREDAKARKESPAESHEMQSGEPDAQQDDAAEEEDRAPAPASAKPAREPLTKAGQALIAKAKTDGIRAALHDRRDQLTDRELLGLLVLALCADNVRVMDANQSGVKFHDLAARLIDEDGAPTTAIVHGGDSARHAAAEAIARIVICHPADPKPWLSSGPAAEWIGAVLRPTLPRLDTPEILATVRGDALAEAAIAAGDTGKGTTKALRERLANRCPDLRLPGCDFTAPGPAAREAQEGEGGEDG